MIWIHWTRLTDAGQAPVRKHANDAGWDLIVSRDTVLPPGSVSNVPTDIAVSIPPGWFGHLTGRSSTAKRWGLIVVETVIDAGYRGELFFQVENPAPVEILVPAGRRLAQILFLPVPVVKWIETDHLPQSTRGDNGLGSTGE